MRDDRIDRRSLIKTGVAFPAGLAMLGNLSRAAADPPGIEYAVECVDLTRIGRRSDPQLPSGPVDPTGLKFGATRSNLAGGYQLRLLVELQMRVGDPREEVLVVVGRELLLHLGIEPAEDLFNVGPFP